MTRRGQLHHRLAQELPAEVLLTPGTFDEEIALAPVLIARLQRTGVLAQTSALLAGLAGSEHPHGIPLPQLGTLPQHEHAAAQRHTDPFFRRWRWSVVVLGSSGVSATLGRPERGAGADAARSGSAQACVCGGATGQS